MEDLFSPSFSIIQISGSLSLPLILLLLFSSTGKDIPAASQKEKVYELPLIQLT
jgi:hypothetical protein